MDADLTDRIVALLPRLRAFALALSGSRADGDDLVQATCEKALAARQSWAPGTRLDSWMFRIMQNHWIDAHRARRPQVAIEEAGDERLFGSLDGAREAEARLHLRDVGAALEALPQEQRVVLLLVCVDDMSYREAADTLGVPVGTVMSRLARGRQALLRRVEGEAEEASWQRRPEAAK